MLVPGLFEERDENFMELLTAEALNYLVLFPNPAQVGTCLSSTQP